MPYRIPHEAKKVHGDHKQVDARRQALDAE